jgi:amidase
MSSVLPDEEFASLCAVAESDDRSPHARYARDVTQRMRDWSIANERRLELVRRWAAMFRDYDVMLCPVTPTAAIPHDHTPDADARTITVNGAPRPYWDQVRWVQALSLVHLPVAVAPIGLTRSGLPVGIQVVGPYLEDRTVVDMAMRLGELLGGYRPPPGFQPG